VVVASVVVSSVVFFGVCFLVVCGLLGFVGMGSGDGCNWFQHGRWE
jgi:hypothetical protein